MARSRTPVPKRKPRAKSKKKTPQKRKAMDNIPKQAMSVDQFCHAHGIGRDLFYELMRLGQGPQCMLLKRRRLISFESAAAWRAKRAERETTTEVAA
jgi:hypothetical protein